MQVHRPKIQVIKEGPARPLIYMYQLNHRHITHDIYCKIWVEQKSQMTFVESEYIVTSRLKKIVVFPLTRPTLDFSSITLEILLSLSLS